MILASKAREACLARQYDALFQQIYQDDALVSLPAGALRRGRFCNTSAYMAMGKIEFTAHRDEARSAATIPTTSTAACWPLLLTWTSLPSPAGPLRQFKYNPMILPFLPSK